MSNLSDITTGTGPQPKEQEEPSDWHEPPHVRMLSYVQAVRSAIRQCWIANDMGDSEVRLDALDSLDQLEAYFAGLCQHCGTAEPVEPGHDRCHACLLHEARDEDFVDPFAETP